MKSFPEPPFPSLGYNVSRIADWVELKVMATGEVYSIGDLDSSLRRSDLTRGIEGFKERIWGELHRRQSLTGSSWPLRFENEELFLKTRPRHRIINFFLCATAFETSLTGHQRELFEHCARNILEPLTNNPVMRLGHPRSGSEDRGIPRDLDKAIARYAEASVEISGEKTGSGARGDRGLDLVTWIGPPDGRSGRPHILGQCATGNDWTEKFNDPPIGSWGRYITYAYQPIRMMAIPHVVEATEWLKSTRDFQGYIVDRPRLLRLSAKANFRPKLFNKITEECGLFF